MEQTINSAAKSSALAVYLFSVIELRVDAKLFARLKRVMFGHLLLLSSAKESAGRGPRAGVLILRGLGSG